MQRVSLKMGAVLLAAVSVFGLRVVGGISAQESQSKAVGRASWLKPAPMKAAGSTPEGITIDIPVTNTTRSIRRI
jgi:hypothetical protein